VNAQFLKRCRSLFLVAHPGRTSAQKLLILGSRSFHFVVNRIKHLEGARRQGFWAKSKRTEPGLRDSLAKIELFLPNSKPVSRGTPWPVGVLGLHISD
jgi:hypothetical protein